MLDSPYSKIQSTRNLQIIVPSTINKYKTSGTAERVRSSTHTHALKTSRILSPISAITRTTLTSSPKIQRSLTARQASESPVITRTISSPLTSYPFDNDNASLHSPVALERLQRSDITQVYIY